jgi:hypothetical protein
MGGGVEPVKRFNTPVTEMRLEDTETAPTMWFALDELA